jgi:hypothetical protein
MANIIRLPDEIVPKLDVLLQFGERLRPDDVLADPECICCFMGLEPESSLRLPCGHVFHEDCIAKWFHHEPWCPTCRRRYSIKIGTGPKIGTMTWTSIVLQPHGETCPWSIQMTFHFPSGTDEAGRAYQERSVIAYLPDNNLGNHVLELLKTAFRRRVLFRVGESQTERGLYWPAFTNIHLKTGAEGHCYPDETYLPRVIAELEQSGVSAGSPFEMVPPLPEDQELQVQKVARALQERAERLWLSFVEMSARKSTLNEKSRLLHSPAMYRNFVAGLYADLRERAESASERSHEEALRLVYHGNASLAGCESILEHGFFKAGDVLPSGERVPHRQSLFGPGIYVAADAKLAAQYVVLDGPRPTVPADDEERLVFFALFRPGKVGS